MPDALGLAPSKILSNHRRNGETERDDRQKERLHHAHANTESGLRRRSEADDDGINERDINEQQDKLGAGRQTDLQHCPPGFHLRPKLGCAETHVMKTWWAMLKI